MKVERYGWYSPRVGKDMNILVYGHYGSPLMMFPTSAGDERELEGQSMISALTPFIDAGRIKVFCVNAVNNESWYNKQVHPGFRSWLQVQYDSYLKDEVAPFIRDSCRDPGIWIATMGASFGAYHAANTVLKHPDIFKRCFALSGVYDLRRFMNGHYDDNFYFNNPVDYMASMSDSWYFQHYATCDIHLATGTGPYEDSGPTYRFSEILSARGVPHSVDNWGPDGGHDWPYWKHQMGIYINRLY